MTTYDEYERGRKNALRRVRKALGPGDTSTHWLVTTMWTSKSRHELEEIVKRFSGADIRLTIVEWGDTLRIDFKYLAPFPWD